MGYTIKNCVTLDRPANRDECFHVGQLDKFRAATFEGCCQGLSSSSPVSMGKMANGRSKARSQYVEEGCTMESQILWHMLTDVSVIFTSANLTPNSLYCERVLN